MNNVYDINLKVQGLRVKIERTNFIYYSLIESPQLLHKDRDGGGANHLKKKHEQFWLSEKEIDLFRFRLKASLPSASKVCHGCA